MIGLFDIDSKVTNLALMKLSAHFKSMGELVEFVNYKVNGKGNDKRIELLNAEKYSLIYVSTIFTKSRVICERLLNDYGDKIVLGGTGWDFQEINGKFVEVSHTELSYEIENLRPDYNLYTKEMIYSRICRGIGTKEKKMEKAETIVNAGIGFTSRGCSRSCEFCLVSKKEGCFRHVSDISNLLNPKSNVLILSDNNLTADPHCVDKLNEIRDRKLIVDINQGCDVRLMTDDIAAALGSVKHLRSLHYAWDLMGFESQVVSGIRLLSKYVKAYNHMCFMLTGFNTSFEEDEYRFRRLLELKVDPFVMVYNQKDDLKLKHFARWVNSRIYKKCSFSEYTPWIRAQETYYQVSFL